MSTRFSDVKGSYVYLTLDGEEYRVYYEEAGEGVPVIMQHTAGSDGRQWRHLLEDPELAVNYRLIAVDLPYHGKSLPPTSVEWWTREYKLTQDFFTSFHKAFAEAIGAERPIYMGCSMGGHLAPDLAYAFPGFYRAVIGVEAALDSHGIERIMPWFHYPRANNDSKPALMYTLCSPTSPESFKRETVWTYSQGAPPVFKGDLNYYLLEHDVNETAKDIDTAKTKVFVLNGEYDWSAPPPKGEALVAKIPGAVHVPMRGLGHFPMSEDPASFKRYIVPVLEEAAAD